MAPFSASNGNQHDKQHTGRRRLDITGSRTKFTMSMADASSKNQSGVDAVPECTTDPELGTGAPLGRSNSFTLKTKTSIQWQDLSVAIKKKRMGVLDDPAAQP
eukprot:CAMPEP_0118824492 /NCGR_PEP_ID=MMETSP1162-20130426/10641_1 /TAXON_ID=33656 /ORGANISM="Phaeocystis Sp, Strain CCMP2710" /LENGTH=102 /DNA_ID=CAMNT_0006755133 /DNA_START=1 /DNA_END=305 /DNA_ORIENTATION=+